MSRGTAARRVSGGAAVAAGLLALCAPLSASAAGSSFNTTGHNVDHVGAGQTLSTGTLVSFGFHVQVKGGNNPATTLYLANATASLRVSCTQNGPVAGTWTVALPSGPFSIPAGYRANGGWWPIDKQRDPRSYQLVRSFPGAWCGGKPVHVVSNGETYSGALQSSNNTTTQFHLQLHTAAPAATGAGNVDCTSTSQNPQPGTAACDFAWNGDADNLVPSARSGATGGSQSLGGGAGGNAGESTTGASDGDPGFDGVGAVPVPATGSGVPQPPALLLVIGIGLCAWSLQRRRSAAWAWPGKQEDELS